MILLEEITRFNNKHRVLSHTIFWLAILAMSSSQDSYVSHDDTPFMYTLAYYATLLVTQIMAAYFLAYFIVPRLLNTKKYLLAIVWFVIGSYLICVLARFINIRIDEPMYGKPRNPNETNMEILTNLVKLVYVYFFRVYSVALVFLFVKLLKGQIAFQKRALALEKAKAETELKLLKTQLNPHFLFNTLNNIYSLSVHNSPATSESIARLSDILDHILYRCGNVYVPLATEIALLENYIALEKLRYDERLTVQFTIDIDHDVDIAPLIMLSLVENAFKHGAGQDMGSPVIDIGIQVSGNVFTCRVANSFAGSTVGGQHEKIGLLNLQQQLGMLYPGSHMLDIKQTDSLFVVTLVINLQPEKQLA